LDFRGEDREFLFSDAPVALPYDMSPDARKIYVLQRQLFRVVGNAPQPEKAGV
jgi:hypothetical protein